MLGRFHRLGSEVDNSAVGIMHASAYSRFFNRQVPLLRRLRISSAPYRVAADRVRELQLSQALTPTKHHRVGTPL
jgi:hypothetical protein